MASNLFKESNYIQVPGFAIVQLKLSGNELLCFSLIYGFSQDDESEFHGSLTYISSALNVTRQNALRILERLQAKDLIIKKEQIVGGVKLCHYVHNSNGVAEMITPRYQNSNGGVIETATGGVIEIATHNKDINNIYNKDNNIPADGELFQAPEKKRKQAHTTETLCLFAHSRYSDPELFEAEFRKPEFAGIDIIYYYHAVADWSAQKGKKMRDWIATARNFIRSDIEKNKLHRLTVGGAALSPDAIKYLQDMAD